MANIIGMSLNFDKGVGIFSSIEFALMMPWLTDCLALPLEEVGNRENSCGSSKKGQALFSGEVCVHLLLRN